MNGQDGGKMGQDERARWGKIKVKSAVGFGRDVTPFILKGWIGKWGSNGLYGKKIDYKIIRASVKDGE